MGVLSRFALRNPVVIVLILVLVTGSGIYSAFNLHQEDLPDVSVPVITVSATYANAPAALVLDSVTKPLEAALAGVSGVQALDSVSAQGVSRVVAQFTVGGDARAVQRDVQDAINGVTLPAAVGRPQVTLSTSNNRPVVTYSLSGADTVHLTQIAQNSVVPALQSLNGVASVDVLGGAPLDVLVTADPAKLRSHNLSIASLDSAIAAGTASQPAGQVTVGGVSMPLRAGNAPDSLAAIRALPIVPAAAGLSAALSGASAQGTSANGQRVTPAQQTAVYLNAARAALTAYEGKNAQSGAFGLDTSPTGVAQTDIVQALSDLQQHPADAAAEARAAERSLLLLARKNSALYSNPNFASALGWLHTANTALALAAPSGPQLTVGDVATVSLGTPGVGAIARSNGRSGVLVQVTRNGNADVMQLSAAVRNALNSLRLPPGVHMTKVYDNADTIATSVGGAAREGLAGVILAVIIIGLFLRNWRATLIAVVTVPVAFLLTLIWLNALGLTLNVITLAGFAVATGRVVDDSIVVIENLYRRIARGEAVTQATVQAGVVDVGAAITSSTATTVCVFLPLAFAAGLVNVFFAPFAWTVTVALISSYLAAVTIVPLLAYMLFARGGAPREGGEGALTRRYRDALAWSLDHRLTVLGVAALTVVLALVILRRTPTNLFAQSGPASAVVNVTAPLGSTVQTTGAAVAKIERVIGTDPDVDSYYTTIGDFNQHGILGASARLVQSNQGSITVNFKNGVDGNAATTHLRDLLNGGRYGAAVDVHLNGGANSALEVDVTGSNPANIGTVTREVEAAIRAVGGVDNVTDTLAAAKPEIHADVDPVRAARYGLTPATVVTQLQALVNGVTAAHVSLNGAATDVVVSLAPAALSSPSALGDLPIGTAAGTVALRQIASLHSSSGTALITRHDQQLASRVTGNIISADVGGVSNGIARKLKALHLPGDTQVVLAGASQQQSVAFSSVYSAMAIAVVLVFIVMVMAFRTLAAPVSILFALPVTLIGAALGLALGRQTLGLPALIGLLMLIGIVVTNAIVLMTRVQQYREAGAPLRTALLDAGANRLRPIMMTAVATIGALLPLSLGFSEGSLISQSLADTVIGGLVSSTVLTLVVVPVVFSLLVREQSAISDQPSAEYQLLTADR